MEQERKSEAERFWEVYGFRKITTGGNCTAFSKTDSEGIQIVVTNGDPHVPDTKREAHFVSWYGVDGQAINAEPAGREFPNAEAAIYGIEPETVKLVAVINEYGERDDSRKGNAIRGDGCIDEEGKPVAGGWDANGLIWCNETNNDGFILNIDGTPTQLK